MKYSYISYSKPDLKVILFAFLVQRTSQPHQHIPEKAFLKGKTTDDLLYQITLSGEKSIPPINCPLWPHPFNRMASVIDSGLSVITFTLISASQRFIIASREVCNSLNEYIMSCGSCIIMQKKMIQVWIQGTAVDIDFLYPMISGSLFYSTSFSAAHTP